MAQSTPISASAFECYQNFKAMCKAGKIPATDNCQEHQIQSMPIEFTLSEYAKKNEKGLSPLGFSETFLLLNQKGIEALNAASKKYPQGIDLGIYSLSENSYAVVLYDRSKPSATAPIASYTINLDLYSDDSSSTQFSNQLKQNLEQRLPVAHHVTKKKSWTKIKNFFGIK